MLLDARRDGKNLRVIVADGRPHYDGKELVRKLSNAGVECQYIQVSAVPTVMSEVK